MGMCADNQAGAPVAEMAHCHLFTGRLAVDIHNDRLRLPAQGMLFQQLIHQTKRILKGALHEHLTQHLTDQHLAPARVRKQARSPARCAFGKVYRANDAWLCLGKLQHVFLVKRMIAQRHHICPGFKQTLCMFAA